MKILQILIRYSLIKSVLSIPLSQDDFKNTKKLISYQNQKTYSTSYSVI